MPEKEAIPTTRNAQVRKFSKVSKLRQSSLSDAPIGRLTLQQGEPADCFVTGASRSLQRRCLGLNIPVGPVVDPMIAARTKKLVSRPKTLSAH